MRVKWIDNAKGIAMICIIIGHIGGGTFGKVDLSFVHVFHLIAFFMLSGYTLKIQKVTGDYVNKKFCRLMTPYFYTCVAVMVMDIINSIVIAKDASILTITHIISVDLIRSFYASGSITNFAGIEMGTRIGAIWFLPALFFSLLITQLILNYYTEQWKRWGAAILVALIGYISSRYIWLPFSIQAGMTASIFILAGYNMREYALLEKLKWNHYLIFLGIFIFGVYKEFDHFYIVANVCPDLIVTFLVALFGSLILFKVAIIAEKVRIINFIGRQSLIVMCVHLFSLETLGWYFEQLINFFDINDPVQAMLVSLILNMFFALLGTLIVIVFLKIRSALFDGKNTVVVLEKRDHSADVLRGVLIIAMIVGHSAIDSNLRRIIFSCHLVGFVFLSGYFYKPREKFGEAILHIYKSFLVPYIIFCLIHLILQLDKINIGSFIQYFQSYIFAISFSKAIFCNTLSIGSIWFLNMLFVVRLIYILIDYFITRYTTKIFVVIMFSVIGVELGIRGYWLPWSLDSALYCLIFYQIGVLCKKLKILECVCKNYGLYFVFSIIWAYMIYTSGMEIAVRQYLPYGSVIFGAVSAIFILYMLSRYISSNMSIWISGLLRRTGENMLYIVIVHELFGRYIYFLISNYLNDNNIYHMAVYVLLQIAIGILSGVCINKFIKDVKRMIVIKN